LRELGEIRAGRGRDIGEGFAGDETLMTRDKHIG